ncbi:MAG: benzoate-CoA ligase family protein [Thermoleophilaceae bacterium]
MSGGRTLLSYEDIPERFNLATYFVDRHLEEGRGSRVALYVDDRKHTYAEVARATNRIGNVLQALEVRADERVLLALSDGLDFVAAWYGTLKIGAVVAETYTFLQPKDYAYYLNYTRAGVVIVDETTRAKVAAIADECPHLRYRVVAGEVSPAGLAPGEVALAEISQAVADELDAADTSKDDIALWKFTTGSTGAPKAAVHCHHDPLISFASYAKAVIGYCESDIVMPVPKLFFGYARDATVLFTFGVGAAGVIFPERSTPDVLFELIRRHRPTILVQVPTMMNAMANSRDAEEQDLSSIRLVISSGEALPVEVHERWLRTFGVEVLEGIGSSEAYHIYISNRPGEARPGSVGKVVPGYRARIVGPDGTEAAAGEEGELWVSGESTGLLYWADHQRTKRTFFGDDIRTGDVFVRDTDGYFWYRGRADELLKVGGIFVAPLEIEACLREHPDVSDCAVVGYEASGLQLPRAYVVASGDPSAELADLLKQFVRARLSPHKYPRDVQFVDELPKTPSGKINRRALSPPPATDRAR